MPTRRPASPRSLADDLRARDDAQLVALLRARPDLAAPVPTDITSLAARAGTRASVQRALDRLDTPTLQAVDALAVLPEPTTRADVARLLGQRPAQAGARVTRLRDLALVWGRDSDLRLVRTVRDALGPYPAGLGPSLTDLLGRRESERVAALARALGLDVEHDQVVDAVAARLAAPASLDALLQTAPDGASTVLERLAWGPPVGAVPRADRVVETDSRAPVEWLLAHGLLAVADAGHVVLPREVAIHLRGGRIHRDAGPALPTLTTHQRPTQLVDRTAGSAAAELLRLVGELATDWGLAPPPMLRAGGLGVRELRRTAITLDVDETTAAFVVELAYAAGLVADDGEAGPSWAPTPGYDLWADAEPGPRWAQLAAAWRVGTRVAGLVGSRDERGTARAALSPDIDRGSAREVRAAVLTELAQVPAGAAADPGSLLERLRWRRPRRAGRLHEELVGWTLREAELLGVTGRGALSGPGRALVAGPLDAVAGAAEMAALLPAPVDHVLLQADLTAVAPGPLEPELGRVMALSADVESRGGATVYRFSAASVRRALDAGWSATALVDLLARSSRTPVPQPLEYLVQDVARRHGQVRVGRAASYVRSDDPAVLGEVLADRRSAVLQLRRLAPTVLSAQAEPATVLAVLREIGLAPAAESPGGDLLVRRPDTRRTPVRQPPRPSALEPPAPSEALLDAVVRALRMGQQGADDEQVRAQGRPGPRLGPTDPTVTIATLREAAAGRQRVWIGYADATGRVERRVVEPLTVEGGRVTAFDHGSEEVRTFSVHRVTGVAAADEPA